MAFREAIAGGERDRAVAYCTQAW